MTSIIAIYINVTPKCSFEREFKGLEAQVLRSKHNLNTYIRVGKALIDENSCPRQLRPALP